jgi:hypothetical protein
VEVGRENFTWEEARSVSLLKNRPDSYPLEVTSVEDLGIIDASIFTPEKLQDAEQIGSAAFAENVNDRVAISKEINRLAVKDLGWYRRPRRPVVRKRRGLPGQVRYRGQRSCG